MVEFRRMRPEDVETVYRFTVEGLRPHLYPLVLSPEKVRAVIQHFVASPHDFHLAAFDGEEMVGGIAAGVQAMLWFERAEANVVMFRATRPGVGGVLLQRMFEWARSDMRVKRVLLPMEFDAPAAMSRYLRRQGFEAPQAFSVAYT